MTNPSELSRETATKVEVMSKQITNLEKTINRMECKLDDVLKSKLDKVEMMEEMKYAYQKIKEVEDRHSEKIRTLDGRLWGIILAVAMQFIGLISVVIGYFINK